MKKKRFFFYCKAKTRKYLQKFLIPGTSWSFQKFINAELPISFFRTSSVNFFFVKLIWICGCFKKFWINLYNVFSSKRYMWPVELRLILYLSEQSHFLVSKKHGNRQVLFAPAPFAILAIFFFEKSQIEQKRAMKFGNRVGKGKNREKIQEFL